MAFSPDGRDPGVRLRGRLGAPLGRARGREVGPTIRPRGVGPRRGVQPRRPHHPDRRATTRRPGSGTPRPAQPIGRPMQHRAVRRRRGVQPRRPDRPHRELGPDGPALGRRDRRTRSAGRWPTTTGSRRWRSAPTAGPILTGSYDRTARLWDAATGAARRRAAPAPALRRVGRLQPRREADPHRVLRRHRPALGVATAGPSAACSAISTRSSSVAFSPDGRTVLTGSFDRTAPALGGPEPAGLSFAHEGFIRAVLFSPDGRDHPDGQRGPHGAALGRADRRSRSARRWHTTTRWRPSRSAPTAGPS